MIAGKSGGKRNVSDDMQEQEGDQGTAEVPRVSYGGVKRSIAGRRHVTTKKEKEKEKKKPTISGAAR